MASSVELDAGVWGSRTARPGQGAGEGARNGGVPWHVGYRHQEPRTPIVAGGVRLECEMSPWFGGNRGGNGVVPRCHQTKNAASSGKLDGGEVEKGRCQECRRDRTAQARRKHERLRQGASGSPPIRGPANGATVPPSRCSANNTTPPLNLHLTITHTHSSFILGSCFSRGDKPSCGASVLHRVLGHWCHPGLLVHLALSWLQVGSCPVTHMDGRQVRPNVGVFHQISVYTSQSGNLVCHRALFHGQGLGSTETRCSPHLFSPILGSASTYSTCSHCIRLQGAALDLALRGVWSLHLGKDDHRSNNISTMKQTRYLHPAAGT